MKLETRTDYRRRRHLRVRRKVKGSASRPRMTVFVSNRRMYVQFVDDDAAKTLAAVSTLGGKTKDVSVKNTVEIARQLGAAAAAAALEKGFTTVVFDRGGFPYRGRVKALAEAARAAGLKF